MAIDPEKLRKSDPRKLAQEFLAQQIGIKRPIRNNFYVSATGATTYKDFLTDYMAYEDMMSILADIIIATKDEGNTFLEGKLRDYQVELIAPPPDYLTRKDNPLLAEAVGFMEEALRPKRILAAMVGVIERVAEGKPLGAGHPLNDRQILVMGLNYLREIKEDLKMYMDIVSSVPLRDAIKGIVDREDLLKNDMLSPEEKQRIDAGDMDAIEEALAKFPSNINKNEEMAISAVNEQIRVRHEDKILGDVIARLMPLYETLGIALKRQR